MVAPAGLVGHATQSFFFYYLDSHSCQVKALLLERGYDFLLSGVVIEEVMADFRADDWGELVEAVGSGNISVRESILALWHHMLMENPPPVLLWGWNTLFESALEVRLLRRRYASLGLRPSTTTGIAQSGVIRLLWFAVEADALAHIAVDSSQVSHDAGRLPCYGVTIGTCR